VRPFLFFIAIAWQPHAARAHSSFTQRKERKPVELTNFSRFQKRLAGICSNSWRPPTSACNNAALEEVEAAEKFVPKWIIRFEINLIDEVVSYNHISFERCVFLPVEYLPVERPGYRTVMKMQRVNSVYRNELTFGSIISALSKTSVNIFF
jgi:hypothetical protein